eukprot:scaffold903_cov262-Pinguiococcus_pyrenoidosus.AAC.10
MFVVGHATAEERHDFHASDDFCCRYRLVRGQYGQDSARFQESHASPLAYVTRPSRIGQLRSPLTSTPHLCILALPERARAISGACSPPGSILHGFGAARSGKVRSDMKRE